MDVGYASSVMIVLALIVLGSVVFFASLRKKVSW